MLISACDIGRYYDSKTVNDGVVLMRNKHCKKSLAAYCEWDGDKNNMEFTVPDEYCGYKVKCLGAKGNPGFTGNPGSFGVRLPDKIDGYTCISLLYGYVPDTDKTVSLNFTVNIGKYICELQQISSGRLYGYGIINDDKSEDIIVYYDVKVYYNVDSENQTFYSKDGDLYYKSNGKIVEYR
ncbi:MAG: hypothetical protein K2O81_01310 [Clostridia bacterium]|nr:hypothetical protein [Clostridia bacterium]